MGDERCWVGGCCALLALDQRSHAPCRLDVGVGGDGSHSGSGRRGELLGVAHVMGHPLRECLLDLRRRGDRGDHRGAREHLRGIETDPRTRLPFLQGGVMKSGDFTDGQFCPVLDLFLSGGNDTPQLVHVTLVHLLGLGSVAETEQESDVVTQPVAAVDVANGLHEGCFDPGDPFRIRDGLRRRRAAARPVDDLVAGQVTASLRGRPIDTIGYLAVAHDDSSCILCRISTLDIIITQHI